MRILSCLSAAFLFVLFSSACTNASIVTESFSGTGALVTPGNTGDHSGNTFTVVTTDISGCSQISFDVSVTTSVGVVHLDTRGFGDSGGTNNSQDAFQGNEEMVITISAPTVSLTAAGVAAGAVITSNSIMAEFTSFDIVDNGNNAPTVDWEAFSAAGVSLGTGTGTSPGGGSGTTTTVSMPATTTTIDLAAGANFSWINNAQFNYSGDVVLDKPATVPEPGSLALLLVGLGLVSARRRK